MELRIRALYKLLLSITRQLPPTASPSAPPGARVKAAFTKPLKEGNLNAALSRGASILPPPSHGNTPHGNMAGILACMGSDHFDQSTTGTGMLTHLPHMPRGVCLQGADGPDRASQVPRNEEQIPEAGLIVLWYS